MDLTSVRTLPPRIQRRVRQLLAGTVAVRMPAWDTATVVSGSRQPAVTYRLDADVPMLSLRARRLTIAVPDPASLGRLIASSLLGGEAQGVEVRIADVPGWLRGGVRLAPTTFSTTELRWRFSGAELKVELTWGKPRPLERVLSDIAAAVGRDRRWPEAGGTVYVADRGAFLAGRSTWPAGTLSSAPPPRTEETLGAAKAVPPLEDPAAATLWPLSGPLANPHGRVLLGPPARYSLHAAGGGLLVRDGLREVLRFDGSRSPESVTAGDRWQKFCVLEVPEDLPRTAYATLALRALTACGALLVVRSASLRVSLTADGFTCTEDDPSEGADETGLLACYARSAAASRDALIRADALLRHTPLNGASLLSLPSVSVTLSSKRADDLDRCLAFLAAQDYPAYEVVVGTHGFQPDPQTRRRWLGLLPDRLRLVGFSEGVAFGDVLGALARVADGDLLTKVDDDDSYGPGHLTDLVVALRASGADLVSKSSRFTYFADEDVTLDRANLASERFDATPAGGTLMLSRGTLAGVGGWSRSVRHVDTDLVTRLSTSGAVRYRTAALGYVYVRRWGGHTWAADHEELAKQAVHRYAGKPAALLG